MELNEINKQIQNNPISKDQAKKQFVDMTKELDIKHTFSFDEAYEIGMELRKRKAFRDQISQLETLGKEEGHFLTPEETKKLNPVKHTFADGCYIREIFNPANELLVTKIHKKEHPFFLMKGKMSILTEEGIKHIEAPHHGITRPGTKRIIFTHTDCVFVTVHATDKTTVEEVEKQVIAEDFTDPEIAIEDINRLKESIKLKQQ